MYDFKLFNEMIMGVSKLAKERKGKGYKVIDTTLGMLYDENNRLMEIDLLNTELKNQINCYSKVYDSFIGSVNFNKYVLNWFLRDIRLDCFIGCGYTMGATGALSFFFSNYCKEKKVLVPSIRWGNYDSILEYYDINKIEYLLFNDNDKFNVENLKEIINKQDDDICILINDPCHNPTGYTMEHDEWDEMLNFLSQQSLLKKICVILDLAYLDYTNSNFYSVLKKISNVVNNNLDFYLCFSFSKSFGLYGYRGGVAVALVNTQEKIELFYKRLKTYSRITWSSPNHLLTNTFEILLSKKEKINQLRTTILSYKELLNFRRKVFIEASKKYELELFPNTEGFFILIKTSDPILLTKLLIKDNIFVIPFPQGIRVAISSVSVIEANNIPKLIKKRVDELEFSKISDFKDYKNL